MEKNQTYQNVIDSSLPAPVRRNVCSTIERAYLVASQLQDDTPFLKTPSATAQFGVIIRLSVEYALSQLIENGGWGTAQYSWADYSRPTGRYLRVISNSTVITISQVQNGQDFPRNAVFRNNQRLNNNPAQLSLAFSEDVEKIDDTEMPHILLLHGYQNLNFVRAALPHSEKKEYVYCSWDFLRELRTVPSDKVMPVEVIPDLSVPALKDIISREAEEIGKKK